MAIKISPEIWIAKFVKSATNGRVITVRLRRILTLLILPIWLLGLGITSYYCYKAIIAIPKYNEEKEIMKSIGGVGYYYPTGYANDEMISLEEDIKGFISIIYYLAICFIIPWIILRLTFWIIDADNAKSILN